MPRYKLHIAYHGGGFSGWQKQPETRTVQGEIETAISTIYQQEIEIAGAGRTDAGVHAEGQVAHTDLPTPPEADFQNRLNKLLSPDAAITGIDKVSDDYHARFDASWRQYRYDLLLRPNPVFKDTAWYIFREVDKDLLSRCLNQFRGIHDFKNFSKFDPQQEHTNADVHFVTLEEITYYHLRVRIRANRFLRNMVRRIIGVSVDVATGKMDPEVIQNLLLNKKTDASVYTAPAHGLVLEEVGY